MSVHTTFLFEGVKVCRINLHAEGFLTGLELLDEGGEVVARVDGLASVQLAHRHAGHHASRELTPSQLDRLMRVLDEVPRGSAS